MIFTTLLAGSQCDKYHLSASPYTPRPPSLRSRCPPRGLPNAHCRWLASAARCDRQVRAAPMLAALASVACPNLPIASCSLFTPPPDPLPSGGGLRPRAWTEPLARLSPCAWALLALARFLRRRKNRAKASNYQFASPIGLPCGFHLFCGGKKGESHNASRGLIFVAPFGRCVLRSSDVAVCNLNLSLQIYSVHRFAPPYMGGASLSLLPYSTLTDPQGHYTTQTEKALRAKISKGATRQKKQGRFAPLLPFMFFHLSILLKHRILFY